MALGLSRCLRPIAFSSLGFCKGSCTAWMGISSIRHVFPASVAFNRPLFVGHLCCCILRLYLKMAMAMALVRPVLLKWDYGTLGSWTL